MSGEGDRASLR